MTSESRWEQEAERWVRWARTPGHDAYWYYSPSFFDTILPRPAGRTLEIGCGEGRVARDLARRGHTVVALDTSPTLVRSAKAADPERVATCWRMPPRCRSTMPASTSSWPTTR